MDLDIIARVVHVICVVLWIGGVAMVTTVMIPVLKNMDTKSEAFQLFHTFEKKFAMQARFTTALAAISGFSMLEITHGWSRFFELSQWWLHGMVLIWGVFAIMLFIIEPFVLPLVISKLSSKDSKQIFPIMHRVHVVLLTGSVITIAGVVAGSHGWIF